ncbi:addiction module protein [Thiolapillus sp.]
MGSKELLEQALTLKPEEKAMLIEGLLNSLDEPDSRLDSLWAEEAEKRLRAYREGRLQAVPLEKVFRA